jgi:hypothetical protein
MIVTGAADPPYTGIYWRDEGPGDLAAIPRRWLVSRGNQGKPSPILVSISETDMRYAVVVEKTRNNYSAYGPDLPRCVATGAMIEET